MPSTGGEEKKVMVGQPWYWPVRQAVQVGLEQGIPFSRATRSPWEHFRLANIPQFLYDMLDIEAIA